MILKPPSINSNQFSYHGELKLFTAEASTLDLGFKFKLGQVYDDACDEGFTMISAKTGKEVVFAKVGTDKDREGDVGGWRFDCVTPGHKNLKALIIND